MRKIVCANYDEMSMAAATLVAEQLTRKPNSVLGLPTGSTPLGTYKRLRELCAEGEVDFSGVTTFNLDEYYPIKRSNSQSYYYFMYENLFKHVNILPENVNIPNGECADPAKECAAYDAKIAALGGIDLQLLGIGGNGHIGFNEPSDSLPLATNRVDLTPETIEANSRFFASADEVPKQALTTGMGGIFGAKRILLLINGVSKAQAVKDLFSGVVSAKFPASLLHLHGDVTVLLDKDAASLL
jgi:glucosamine-6-phosphate deaminase